MFRGKRGRKLFNLTIKWLGGLKMTVVLVVMFRGKKTDTNVLIWRLCWVFGLWCILHQKKKSVQTSVFWINSIKMILMLVIPTRHECSTIQTSHALRFPHAEFGTERTEEGKTTFELIFCITSFLTVDICEGAPCSSVSVSCRLHSPLTCFTSVSPVVVVASQLLVPLPHYFFFLFFFVMSQLHICGCSCGGRVVKSTLALLRFFTGKLCGV